MRREESELHVQKMKEMNKSKMRESFLKDWYTSEFGIRYLDKQPMDFPVHISLKYMHDANFVTQNLYQPEIEFYRRIFMPACFISHPENL